MLQGQGKGFPRLALLAMAAVACFLPAPAVAAVITPDTIADEYDTTANSTCSLREAVKSIAGFVDFGGCVSTGDYFSNDTIELPTGVYKLTIAPTGSNDIASGDLNPGSDMTVRALPGAHATIDGNGTDRIFFQPFTTLRLSGLTLTGGKADDPSPSSSMNGGAIFSHYNLTITNTTLTSNSADGFGGAIESLSPLTLRNVTVSGNTTTELAGGGIANVGSDAVLSLDSSTVAANTSQTNDPGSSAVAGGISIGTGGATATVHNSIIAGNTDASDTVDAPDCQGTLTSTGGNVIGDTTGCTFTSAPSDTLNTLALLGTLADNGGPTFTQALQPGSPAINRAVGVSPATDQRGFARPFPAGGKCDSGAFEFGAVLSAPAAVGCPVPSPPGTTPPPTTLPTTAAPPTVPVNPRCVTLRKKLKKAKRAHNVAKVRKIRRKLRRLGC
jgi:CSLREA domain-containing protein